MTRATIDDLLLFQAVAREAYHDAYVADTDPSDLQKYIDENFNTEAVSKELSDADSIVFFLKDEAQKVLGFIKLRWNTTHELLSGKIIELHRIYVMKEYYKKGYGK